MHTHGNTLLHILWGLLVLLSLLLHGCGYTVTGTHTAAGTEFSVKPPAVPADQQK